MTCPKKDATLAAALASLPKEARACQCEVSLRDRFALSAMAALITSPVCTDDTDPEKVASVSYAIADLMLHHRER